MTRRIAPIVSAVAATIRLEHEALSTIEEALALYEHIGNLVMVDNTRARMASLRGPSTAPTKRA